MRSLIGVLLVVILIAPLAMPTTVQKTFTLSVLGQHSVTITWNWRDWPTYRDIGVKFTVMRSEGADHARGPYTVLTTSVTELTYTDNTVEPGKAYWYSVYAMGPSGPPDHLDYEHLAPWGMVPFQFVQVPQ